MYVEQPKKKKITTNQKKGGKRHEENMQIQNYQKKKMLGP